LWYGFCGYKRMSAAVDLKTFEIPSAEGKPAGIADFELYLHASPPEIRERIIFGVDKYIKVTGDERVMIYKDAPVHEGYLNIFICHFKTGKCRLHIFGLLHDEVIHVEREIMNPCSKSIKVLNERIRFVLLQGRNILKAYYTASNMEQLKSHLLDFLLPLGQKAA
jgi:hypothetical protein